MIKHLVLAIPDCALSEFSKYLKQNHYSNAVLGLTLSFGSFSCEVRINSEEIFNLVDRGFDKCENK